MQSRWHLHRYVRLQQWQILGMCLLRFGWLLEWNTIQKRLPTGSQIQSSIWLLRLFSQCGLSSSLNVTCAKEKNFFFHLHRSPNFNENLKIIKIIDYLYFYFFFLFSFFHLFLINCEKILKQINFKIARNKQIR